MGIGTQREAGEPEIFVNLTVGEEAQEDVKEDSWEEALLEISYEPDDAVEQIVSKQTEEEEEKIAAAYRAACCDPVGGVRREGGNRLRQGGGTVRVPAN
ncbi:hypothetical protein EJB05_07383, partial [Eragrostis curvula]